MSISTLPLDHQPPVVSTLPSLPLVSTLPFPPPEVGTQPLSPSSEAGTRPLYENDIASTVGELNKFASQNVPSITFSQDDDSGKTIIRVIDTTDNTVLRQIPSQEALAIAKSLDKLQGWLINQKA